jgi:glycosyltransferase involved in cell wall biosynthesis
MPRLSVIITTYNRVGLLTKAIDSVKNAGSGTEIIVVDDASTDETRAYCSNLPGIKYVRLDTNQKTAAARNAGIAASTAPFIAFLDDDDWRIAGSFAGQMALFDRDSNCGLVHGKVLFCNQQGELTGVSNIENEVPQGDVLIALLRNNFITLSTTVIKKECLSKSGIFDTSDQMVGIEDWDLWLRIASYYSIQSVDEPVAVYRLPEKNSGQWSSNITRQFSLVGLAYKSKWFTLPVVIKKLGTELNEYKRKMMNRTADVILNDALTNSKGNREKWKKFLLAVKCYPSKLVQPAFYKVIWKGIFGY